jgi:hypothetical protein
MATTETTTPTRERVARFREAYADRPWTVHDDREAYIAGYAAVINNALSALDEGTPEGAAEGNTWAQIGALVGWRHRKGV